MHSCRRAVLIAVAVLLTACGRPEPRFLLSNARAHVEMLAGTIGSRPVGTPENTRARAYLIDQLRLYGYDVRVQEIDARRPEIGLTTHVSNIIATRPGAERSAIGILSHYDSSPDAPGGADDGMGVAVSLEAARVLASQENRRHTLLILITDGEEVGLMGAAGLMADADVPKRLDAYINLEAVGSSGTALLFETGPLNAWILTPWAKAAPHPRGASFAIEIYRRLPNDTDFSILKRYDIPGLNFATIGDSYAYHTARDTADRVPDQALESTGENIVATAIAMDGMDLTSRSGDEPTFFDLAGRAAFSWGPVAAWVIALVALALGVLAWFKVLAASIRLVGIGRWLLDLVWATVGVVLVAASMIGATWALRESRAVYHPWYAHPGRLFALLGAIGLLAAWSAARIGTWIPKRAHGPRHPLLVWSLTLPVWIGLAGFMASRAPSAGFLWTLPLLVAGGLLLAAPVTQAAVVRVISVVVLAVAGTLWLRDTAMLLQFEVAVLGRLPIITPVFAYAALMLACAAMVGPPFIAIVAETRPVVRPAAITGALLAVTAIAAALAYAAPAYTSAQPQRRTIRVIVDPAARNATYEVASLEPGLDLNEGAPGGWSRVTDAPPAIAPFGVLPHPFVFRTTAPAPGAAPGAVTAFTLTPGAGGTALSMTVVPRSSDLSVTFVLPRGLQPARTNLPGRTFANRWRATFVAPPVEGVTWRASFPAGHDVELRGALAVIGSSRIPGGSGWQSLPGWLPQERAVWHAQVLWQLVPPPPIAPVPPLR